LQQEVSGPNSIQAEHGFGLVALGNENQDSLGHDARPKTTIRTARHATTGQRLPEAA
jgi:hypothetical protein